MKGSMQSNIDISRERTMTMESNDVETIVQALVVSFAKGPVDGASTLAQLFAETIDGRHVPPSPNDGPISRELVARALCLEWKMFQAALDDFTFKPDVRKLGEDSIGLTLNADGILEGEAVSFTIEMQAIVGGHDIVGLTAGLGNGTSIISRIFASPRVSVYMQEFAKLANSR
jgi:hypothetical protein